MRAPIARIFPGTITGQIILLVVAAVTIGVLLTAAALAVTAGSSRMRMSPEVKAASEAARIATLLDQFARLRTPADLEEWTAGVDAPGAHIRPWRMDRQDTLAESTSAFARRVAADLRTTWHLDARAQDGVAGWGSAVVVRAGTGQGLAFQEAEFQTLQALATLQVAIVLAIVFVTVLALSVYAIWWITKPISVVADAARAFGNSPYDDKPLRAGGPLEIRQLADALNEMRQRIRRLVDERTHMLAAISHDLRTPLTRIRLRAERTTEPLDRSGILGDVAVVDAMIGETLSFLRDSQSTEPMALLDLPSLLQTLCGEYADLGHDVSYSGPLRATIAGRSRALTRALTNVVDNGLKHGSRVLVDLQFDAVRAQAHVAIADNGPGIPAELRERVFEPFFKVDPARSPQRGGFGLGLTIARDIVEQMGGRIALLENRPVGLLVRLSLPIDGAVDAPPHDRGSRGAGRRAAAVRS